MSDFPTLTEMGICCPDEITHYLLKQTAKDKDVLKISYKRKKGSLLPNKKTFKFGRSSKMIVDKSSKSGSKESFEISPYLQKALSELDKLVTQKTESTSINHQILKRVNKLEKEVLESTHEIKELLKDLENSK